MKKTKWTSKLMVMGLATQVMLVGQVFAADAGLEFGAQDDLSVFGTEGNLSDADLEIKGFSLFGSATGLNVPAAFTNGPGSVVISSNLFVAGSLKAGSIDLSGANMTVSNLTVQGFLHAQGDTLDVLKNASMQKSLSVGEGLSVSGLSTLNSLGVTGNSTVGGLLGVTGNGTIGGTLGVSGLSTLSDLDVTGASTLNSVAVTGNGAVGGTLGVTGKATLSSNLVVNSTASSSSKTTGAVVVQGGIGVGENVNVGGALGVDGNSSVTGNSTVGGTLGVTGNAALSGNVTVSGTLAVTGITTLATNVTAAQSAYLATSGGAVGIGNNAPDANTKMQVTGGTNSSDYVAKFYSGATLAAWIKKK